ncbi:Endophilin-A1, partial [Lamprotornis superbus]
MSFKFPQRWLPKVLLGFDQPSPCIKSVTHSNNPVKLSQAEAELWARTATSLTVENDACSGITIKSVVSRIDCNATYEETEKTVVLDLPAKVIITYLRQDLVAPASRRDSGRKTSERVGEKCVQYRAAGNPRKEIFKFYDNVPQNNVVSEKVSEKVGGAEGTKLDDDFKEMERKVDVTSRAVMEIMAKTIEYLQPNPASRAKLSMINTMSKIRGQEKGPGYPQAEALLADAMLKFGRELGEDCNFGPALVDVGEAMKELSEVKDSLDMEVKQNFIDPLQNLHDKDLREIQHHLKKMEGRRLDFDYKKKRQGKLPDEELRQALEKFDESKEIAESSMFNLLEMDIEQVSQLSALVQAQLEYHKQATQILQRVTSKLEDRIKEASSQPRREYQPKPRMSLDFVTGDNTQHNGGISHATTPKPSGVHMDQPCCRALYDFEPENEGELGFKEGDIITLTNQIDENWYEGMLHGQSGFFPINYVDILCKIYPAEGLLRFLLRFIQVTLPVPLSTLRGVPVSSGQACVESGPLPVFSPEPRDGSVWREPVGLGTSEERRRRQEESFWGPQGGFIERRRDRDPRFRKGNRRRHKHSSRKSLNRGEVLEV